jgi:hypothetical protein
MNRFKRIATHGWLSQALSVFTFGYYPSGQTVPVRFVANAAVAIRLLANADVAIRLQANADVEIVH